MTPYCFRVMEGPPPLSSKTEALFLLGIYEGVCKK